MSEDAILVWDIGSMIAMFLIFIGALIVGGFSQN